MATTSITVSGSITGLVEGTNSISFTYSNTSSPGTKDLLTVNGETDLTIPANTTLLLIVPPASNTVAWRISADTGGTTGVTMHLTNPVLLPIAVSSPSVSLYAASSIAGFQIYYL